METVPSSQGSRGTRWWAPVLPALIAFATLNGYMGLNQKGALPVALRDHPWPLELILVSSAIGMIFVIVRNLRARRLRILTSLCAVVSLGITTVAVYWAHSYSWHLPPPPRELAVGTTAPDFTLPDDQGKPFALASLRGKKALLVFYRGFW